MNTPLPCPTKLPKGLPTLLWMWNRLSPPTQNPAGGRRVRLLARPRRSLLLSAAILAAGAVLLAPPKAAAADLNTAGERFLQEEAASGMARVKMAELAAKKVKREDIRLFANQIASEQLVMNAELARLAAQKKVRLTSEPIAQHGDLHDQLERSGATDFEREFLSAMAGSLEVSVRNFAAAAKDAVDREVKMWAEKMRPTLQSHLEKAEALRSAPTVSPSPSGEPDSAPLAGGTASQRYRHEGGSKFIEL